MNLEGLTLGAVVLLLLKELISSMNGSRKDNIKATQENTLALTKLQVEMQNLKELISMIPKMKQDIDVAHERIRQINKGM